MIVKLKSFTTPNFVIPERAPGLRQDGIRFDQSIPIREVDAQELSDLCDAFRAEVFKKADKRDPKEGK